MLNCKEKEEVKRDLTKTLEIGEDRDYKEYSRNIYFGTDKLKEIRKIAADLKKCLILTSSGEYAIDLAIQGADVYTFDINRLSYYAQQLRIGAVSKLEYQEYIEYFLGLYKQEMLSENLYSKLREGLSEKAQIYFDGLYEFMYPEQIFERCFDINSSYKSFMLDASENLKSLNKAFAHYSEEEFYKAKQVDLQKKIHFENFNITDYETSQYSQEEDFDLINLSNVLLFLRPEQQRIFCNLLKEKLKNSLSPSGIITNYFHAQTGERLLYKWSPNNMLYNEVREEELTMLQQFSDETYNIGKTLNGRGCYQDDLIHVIRK